MTSRDALERMDPQERRRLLAELIAKRGGAAAAAPRLEPMSFAQERLWFLDQLRPGSVEYNLPANFGIPGPMDERALRRAFEELARRHEVLRTTFRAVDYRRVQVIAPPQPVPITIVDLAAHPAEQRDRELQRIATEEVFKPFDLGQGPLMRVVVVHRTPEDHHVLVTMHHVICDGWSLEIFYREITELYVAYRDGRPPALPELPIQYADYARWQHRYLTADVLERQIQYWREELADVPSLIDLPIAKPRPSEQSFRGAAQPIRLSRGLSRRIERVGKSHGATTFMTLLAAFKALLFRYSGQRHVVVGTPIANRTRNEHELLIGFFTNSLVLATELEPDLSFAQLLERVRATALGAYQHQDLPFERLVEELQPARTLGHHPLFQVAFNLQTTRTPGSLEVDEPIDEMFDDVAPQISSANAKFDITLSLTDSDHGIAGAIEYATDLFEHETITRLVGHFRMLLASAVADPSTPISRLGMLTPRELRDLDAWNDVDERDPPNHCLHRLFEEQVARTPDAIALSFHESTVTYREADERANQIARHLQARGIERESPVGICIRRSPEMVIAMLAVMKAGGAFVPLDASYPPDRLRFMVEDSHAAIVLSEAALAPALPFHGVEIVAVDGDAAIDSQDVSAPPSSVGPKDLAYIIYTSGSTGRPKGVMVPHEGVANSSRAKARMLELRPGDRMLQFASSSFDVSIFEIVPALMSGMTLCLATKDELMPGPAFVELVDRLQINVMTLPPSVLAVLPSARWPHLHSLLVAGEAFTEDLVARWGEGRRFFNAYGPTEGSIWTAGAFLRKGQRPVIGTVLPNNRIYLLDAAMQRVPVGVPGELYIGGVAVTRGYHRRPELTEQVFLRDPFSSVPGARMYKTGDIARFWPGGVIEYLGRADHQIKLRGFRIELSEIEVSLKSHVRVDNAIVVLHTAADGDRRLVAYVAVGRDGNVEDPELREHLRERLPDYMLPSVFVLLPELPLNSNGKIDRAALPDPDVMRSSSSVGREGSSSMLERVLVGIYAEVLKLDPERVSVRDDFFDLGGHSLLLTQVISRLRDGLQVDVPMRDFFADSSVRGIGTRIRESHPEPDALERTAAILFETVQMSEEEVARALQRQLPGDGGIP